MAWRQIGAKPFLDPMLINHGLEHKEQISVKYFARFENIFIVNIFFELPKF